MARNFNFPVYQVDFSAVAAGKRVAATKRRIRWRFGFPNKQALEAGRTGTDCRGEEHEIVIIWSVTSGKRQILMDGREIHYSANRVGILDHSWNTKGNHVLKTVCHAAPPLSPTPGFRQYDLFIDGQSFFSMPKMYELGVKGSSAAENRSPGYHGYENRSPAYAGSGYSSSPPMHVPASQEEEEEELQRAIKASLEETKVHLGEKRNGGPDMLSNGGVEVATADLLDFDSPPISANNSMTPSLMAAPSTNSFTSAPNLDSYGAPPPPQQFAALPPSQSAVSYGSSRGYSAPPQQQQQFAALPPSQSGGYGQPAYGAPSPSQPNYGAPPPSQPYGAPPPSQAAYGAPAYQYGQSSYGQPPAGDFGGGSYSDPFAPKPPSRDDMTSDILKAYGGGATPTSTTSSTMWATPQSYGHYQPGQPFQTGGSPESQQYLTPQTNAEGPKLSMNGLAITNGDEEDKPKNSFEAAMKKLVNFDHIDEPAEEQLKLTMKKEEDERAKKNKHRSIPLPPAASRVVGSGATLGQISQVKPPTKFESVMKPPAGLFQDEAAMAGALTVYGQGPPPLKPRGFGIVHMQGQYPQQQYGGGYR